MWSGPHAQAWKTLPAAIQNMTVARFPCPAVLWAISSVLGYRAVHDWVWDVDECALDRGLCGPHGQCVNKWWSFTCKCNAGYAFDGTTCVDVDECASGSHECGPHGACVNEEGSYRCECAEGFRQGTFGGRARCVDVDECAETPGLCGAGRCENRPGGYDCQCRSQARLGWISTEVGDHSGTSSVRLPFGRGSSRGRGMPYPAAGSRGPGKGRGTRRRPPGETLLAPHGTDPRRRPPGPREPPVLLASITFVSM